MSEFSEHLKELIKNSGKTVYAISKQTNLERTAIQRTISGTRLPSWDFIEILTDYLAVSYEEKEQLHTEHTIEEIGPTTYFSLLKTKKFFENLSELFLLSNFNAPTIHYDFDEFNYQPMETIHGDYSVSLFLRHFLYKCVKENDKLSLFLPHSCKMFFDILKQLYIEQKGNIDIEHLVLFDNNFTSAYEHNFNSLSEALMFSFNAFNGYKAKYFYENLKDYPSQTAVFPYYIITDNLLVYISSDYKNILYTQNLDVIKMHSIYFNNIYKDAHSLVINNCITGTQLTECITSLLSLQVSDYSFESQPCFAAYFTEALVKKHLRTTCPHYDSVYTHLCTLYASYKNHKEQFVSYFTASGVDAFIKTGICVNLPTAFATPFTTDERIELLQSIINDIANPGNCLYKMIDTSNFDYSPMFSVDYSIRNGLLLLTASDDKILTAHITNKNICEYVHDFMKELSTSSDVHSDVYTINYLNELISKIN